MTKTLICVLGPTASGKTSLAIELAKHYDTEVVSADSRQFYKEMSIGTAKPSVDELQQVPHHLVGHISIQQAYSAGDFANEARSILDHIFTTKNTALLVGGSGMYVHALINGLDVFPAVPEAIKTYWRNFQNNHTVEQLWRELQIRDATYAEVVDKHNPQRIVRAIEVCEAGDKSYSDYLSQSESHFPYQVKKVAIDWEREQLYQRINLRVDNMMEAGLLEEVQALIPFRNANALQTVGYKEIFDYLDGNCTLLEATECIKQNTRRYAKRQLTWLRNKEEGVVWVKPGEHLLADLSQFRLI